MEKLLAAAVPDVKVSINPEKVNENDLVHWVLSTELVALWCRGIVLLDTDISPARLSVYSRVWAVTLVDCWLFCH